MKPSLSKCLFKQFAFTTVFLGANFAYAQPAPATLDHSGPTDTEKFVDRDSSSLVTCSQDQRELSAEDRDALDTLASNKLGMRAYLGRKGHDQKSYDKVKAASNRILKLFETHDPKTCLKGGQEEFHYYCAVASNIDFLSIRDGDLVVQDPKNPGLEFRRSLTESKTNHVGAAWMGYQKGSKEVAAHILTGSGYNKTSGHKLASSIGFSKWYTEKQKVDHFGKKVTEANLGVKDVRFSMDELGVQRTTGCQGSASRPADIYARGIAKAKGQGFDPEKDSFEANRKEVMSATRRESLHRAALDIENSVETVVEGIVGMKNLATNKEMVVDHPNAVACKDPENQAAAKEGKKCLGTFTAMVEILGPKFDEVWNKCVIEVCPTCKAGVSKLNAVQETKVAGCLSVKGGKALGSAAMKMAAKCASNPEELSRCSAHALTAAVTFGGTVAVAKGAAYVTGRASAGLAGLVSTGRISGMTAKVANVVIKVGSKTVVFSTDMLVNQTPLDPAHLGKIGVKEALKIATGSPEQLVSMKAGIPFQREAAKGNAKALAGLDAIENALDKKIAKLPIESRVEPKILEDVAALEMRSPRKFTDLERSAAADHMTYTSFPASEANIDHVAAALMRNESKKIKATGNFADDIATSHERSLGALDTWKAAGRPAIDQKYLDKVVAPIMRGEVKPTARIASTGTSAVTRSPAAVASVARAEAHLAELSTKWASRPNGAKAVENLKLLMDESENFVATPNFSRHVDTRRVEVAGQVKKLESELKANPKDFNFEKRSNLTQLRTEAKELSQATLDHDAARKAAARKSLREKNVPEKDIHTMMDCFK